MQTPITSLSSPLPVFLCTLLNKCSRAMADCVTQTQPEGAQPIVDEVLRHHLTLLTQNPAIATQLSLACMAYQAWFLALRDREYVYRKLDQCEAHDVDAPFGSVSRELTEAEMVMETYYPHIIALR